MISSTTWAPARTGRQAKMTIRMQNFFINIRWPPRCLGLWVGRVGPSQYFTLFGCLVAHLLDLTPAGTLGMPEGRFRPSARRRAQSRRRGLATDILTRQLH